MKVNGLFKLLKTEEMKEHEITEEIIEEKGFKENA